MGIYDNASWGGIGDELQKLDPRNISVDPHQAGLAARRGLENVKGTGQTVGQIASGVAAMPGQTAAGIANTAQPYFDRQFAPMEQQARGFWQGVEDFKRGFGGVQGQQPAAQLPANRMDAYNAAKAQGDVIQDKYFKPSTGELPPAGVNMADSSRGPDPRQQEYLNRTGNAGYQSGGLEGKKVYNTYDPDRPASMGSPQNDPWKDMARQVANFSMLRAMDTTAPMTGSREGDLATLQWRQRMLEQPGRDQSAQGLEALRGRNQQQNTELQYGLMGRNQEAADDRNYVRSMDLEMLKMADPTKAAQAKLYESQGKAYDAHGGLYRAQADAASRGAKANPYFETITKMMDAGLLNPKDPAHAELINKSIGALNQQFGGSGFEGNQKAAEIRAAFQAGKLSKEEARQQLAALNGTAKFAGGGQVESSEQLMARMREKYGLAAPAAEAPAPVQRPAAPAPQPQQKPQSWSEKLRNVATGGLDRRMQGYAQGGPIDVSGRQVLGEGTTKSDSLPAIIDGQHPAALSTEEFVFPVETVRHFGLAKLNKMVEESRKGLDTGRKSA